MDKLESKELLDKLNYLFNTVGTSFSHFGLVAIVPKSEIKGKEMSNDSDEDYFDHQFIVEYREEDDCHGYSYIPINDGSDLYFKFYYYC